MNDKRIKKSDVRLLCRQIYIPKEKQQILRKQKGMSQKTLAQQLNVVRQTISKWEKGLSVPDADMLIRIADVFDTSVSELLGVRIEQEENVNEIAAQLALLNEQLAHKVRIYKKVLAIVIAIIFMCAFAAIYPRWNELWRDFGRNLYYFFISDGVTAIKGPGVRTGTTFNL